MGFGFGGSKSSASTFIDPAQAPFLDFTRNTGMGLTQSMLPQAQQFAGQATDLYNMGLQNLSGLTNNDFLTQLSQFATPNQALLSQQIDQLGADIGRNLNQNILPGIQSDAIGVGGTGGGRQGVAEGIALQGATDALQRGATDLTAQEYMRAQNAAIAGGGLLSQGNLAALQMQPQLFGLGQQAFMSPYAPLMMFDQIVGDPTVLSQSKSKGFNVAAEGIF